MEHIEEIKCEATGKLLARRSVEGIYLWCKVCKTEHLIRWTAHENVSQGGDKVASEAVLCYNTSI